VKILTKKALTTILLLTLFLTTLTIFTAPVFGQAGHYSGPELDWQKTYAGSELAWVAQTSDGGFAFYYAGTQEGGYARYDPAELTKVTSAGNVQWIKNFSLPFPKNFVVTGDGGYAYTTFENDALQICKLDSNGDSQWNQTFSNLIDGNELFIQTNDGGYAVFLHEDKGYPNRVHVEELMILKTDAQGNTQWTKNLPSLDASFSFRSLIQTSDGGYALTGSHGDGEAVSAISSTVSNGTDFCLVKISSDGNLQWTKFYGGADNDDAYSLIQTSDGCYVIVGNTLSFGAGGSDALMIKTDDSGSLLWAQTYGGFGTIEMTYFDIYHFKTVYYPVTSKGEHNDESACLIQTSDGGFAFAGTTQDNLAMWLVKTDSNGFQQWNQTYPANPSAETFHSLKGLLQARDGSFVLAGSYYGTYWHSTGNYVSLAFKTKPAAALPAVSSQPAYLSSLAFEPITINAAGSITPSNAPLTREGNHYRLTADVYSSIIVKADNIVLDGQNHLINGAGALGNLLVLTSGVGLDLTSTNNVKIQNFNLQNFRYAIVLDNSKNVNLCENSFVHDIMAIEGDHVTGSVTTENNMTSTRAGYEVGFCFTYSVNDKVVGNHFLNEGISLVNCKSEMVSGNNFDNSGVLLGSCDNTLICGNDFYNCFMSVDLSYYSDSTKTIVAANNFKNCQLGIIADNAPGNLFYMNSFINITYPAVMYGVQVDENGKSNYVPQRWDDGTVGNYWDNFTQQNPNAQTIGNQETWNTPYIIDADNKDNHPLVAPVSPDKQQALSQQLTAEQTSFTTTLSSSSILTQIILLSIGVIVAVISVASTVTAKQKKT
jgi:hypothetical protein